MTWKDFIPSAPVIGCKPFSRKVTDKQREAAAAVLTDHMPRLEIWAKLQYAQWAERRIYELQLKLKEISEILEK